MIVCNNTNNLLGTICRFNEGLDKPKLPCLDFFILKCLKILRIIRDIVCQNLNKEIIVFVTGDPIWEWEFIIIIIIIRFLKEICE